MVEQRHDVVEHGADAEQIHPGQHQRHRSQQQAGEGGTVFDPAGHRAGPGKQQQPRQHNGYQRQRAQQPHRVIHGCRAQNAEEEAETVAHDAQLALAGALFVLDGHFDHLDVFVQGACAHHRREVEAVGQRVELFQHLALEDALAAGAVGDAHIADHADERGKQEVTDPARQRHFAFRARHTRADHQIGAMGDERLEHSGEVFRRIGAVGVHEGQVVAFGVAEACLERASIVAVDFVLDEDNAPIQIATHDLGSAVFGAVVHHDDLQAVNADLLEFGFDGQGALDARADALFFVISRNNDGKNIHCVRSPCRI